MATYVVDCLLLCWSQSHNNWNNAIDKIDWFQLVCGRQQVMDYLSCDMILDKKDNKKEWLGQAMSDGKSWKEICLAGCKLNGLLTPEMPGQGISRPRDDEHGRQHHWWHREPQITQNRHGSGNAVVFGKTFETRYLECCKRAIESAWWTNGSCNEGIEKINYNFVLATRIFGLKIEPDLSQDKTEWETEIYTDSKNAGDKDTRITVGGYIIFLLGVAILWKWKVQKFITLSSAETKFVGLSEAAT
jgi:hypothetical protein